MPPVIDRLALDLHRIAEIDRVEHLPVLVLYVDAMVANDMAFVFNRLSSGEPHILAGPQPCGRQVGQVSAFGIRGVHVIVEVEEVSGHGPLAPPYCVRSPTQCKL